AADGPASLEMEMTGGFSIRENRAADNGGGIYVDGPALLVMEDPEVWIHLNVADADGDGTGVGGGIYHTGLAEGSLIREEDVFDNVPDDIFRPTLPGTPVRKLDPTGPRSHRPGLFQRRTAAPPPPHLSFETLLAVMSRP